MFFLLHHLNIPPPVCLDNRILAPLGLSARFSLPSYLTSRQGRPFPIGQAYLLLAAFHSAGRLVGALALMNNS